MAKLLNLFGSSLFALILVVLLMLLSLLGVLVPQDQRFQPHDMEAWKAQHPIVSRTLEPVGLFGVFGSWPFLCAVGLLGINIMACTINRLLKTAAPDHPGKLTSLETIGFVFLHVAIVGLLTGGFLTAGGRMKGYIVLTEGQSFQDRHGGYINLIEGPVRKERHTGMVAKLQSVDAEYVDGHYQTMLAVGLEMTLDDRTETRQIEKNRPATFDQLTFTLDEAGFSPRIRIQKQNSPQVLSNSFIALKVFKTAEGKLHRDFVPLPFFTNKVYITLYPAHVRKDDRAIKTGERPDSPLVIVEMEDDSGKIVETVDMPLGGNVTLGGYTFAFEELRQWASFRISDDPGYLVVCVALWLGLAALVLRYVPDLRKWFAVDRGLEEKD